MLSEVQKAKDSGGLGLGVVSDVVWNHTAADSPWLCEHPEAGYNLVRGSCSLLCVCVVAQMSDVLF